MKFTVYCDDNMGWAGIIVIGMENGKREGYSVSKRICDGYEIDMRTIDKKEFTKSDCSGSIKGNMISDLMEMSGGVM